MKLIHQTYAALMALLLLTFAASYLPVNLVFSELIGLSIAWIKAGLVSLVFMKLRDEHPSLRFIALIGLVWVVLLVGFISLEFATRGTIGTLGK